MAGLKRGLALVCFLLAEIMIAAEIVNFGLVQLTLYSACAASFFSRNIIFLSQQFSQNSFFSVSFSQVQTSERNHNICLGQLQRQGLLEGAASWPYHFPTVGR